MTDYINDYINDWQSLHPKNTHTSAGWFKGIFPFFPVKFCDFSSAPTTENKTHYTHIHKHGLTPRVSPWLNPALTVISALLANSFHPSSSHAHTCTHTQLWDEQINFPAFIFQVFGSSLRLMSACLLTDVWKAGSTIRHFQTPFFTFRADEWTLCVWSLQWWWV